MALGTLLWLSAAILTVFSVTAPALNNLRCGSKQALLLIAAGFCASLAPSFEVFPELSLSLFALFLLGFAIAVLWKIKSAQTVALLSALCGGILAFLAQAFLWQWLVHEPSVLPGIFAGVGAAATGRFRRARLFGGLFAPFIAACIPAARTLASSGYAYVQLGGEVFTDMATICFFTACILTAILQHIQAASGVDVEESTNLFSKRP